MMKKIGYLAFGLLFSLAACEEKAEAPAQMSTKEVVRPAKIAVATSSLYSLGKSFPGTTEASRKSTLAFRVSGQILEFPVKAGQVVKKGDLIARLDDTPFMNVLNDRQAKFDFAKTELERNKSLFEKKHVSKSALDRFQANYTAAAVALKQAQDDVGYSKLTAPYDGVIAQTLTENYQNILAKEAIVQFQGNQNIDIVFAVPERLFLHISREKAAQNNAVKVTFDGFAGREFDAYYYEHESIPDAATRSFKVTMRMPIPKDLIVLPGMSVTVKFDLAALIDQASPANELLVPLEAVFEEAGKRWVWKLDAQNAAHKTEVEVTGISEDQIRVSSGLKEGEKVIAVGTSFISEGQVVRPFVKERGL
ncbi:MAG: efflux RND transporter periplasmic adaptor subunit [Cohaesibacter sp.]|nr:efflux RND transporter periplasmic adaptor subunit [Cohaesibacter sp.]